MVNGKPLIWHTDTDPSWVGDFHDFHGIFHHKLTILGTPMTMDPMGNIPIQEKSVEGRLRRGLLGASA